MSVPTDNQGFQQTATGLGSGWWQSSARLKRVRATARGARARALLIPLGAALLAGERVREEFGGILTAYHHQANGVSNQLRQIERRGRIARNRLEREVRLAKMRLERRWRQQRSGLRRRREALSDDLSGQVATAQAQLQRTRRWLTDRAHREQAGSPLGAEGLAPANGSAAS